LAWNYPRIRLVGVAIGDDTMTDTARAAISFLLRYPDVCLLYVSDASAGRVATALRERGFAGRVRVIGTDRTPELLSGLADGTVAATVVQDTYTEEFVALHYLYWRYNGLTLLPDTTFVQIGNLCGSP
jgi:ABC-type sugar transport system substrate-binding protein